MESSCSLLFVNLAVLVEFGEISQQIQDVGASTTWLMSLVITIISLLLIYGVRTGGRLN